MVAALVAPRAMLGVEAKTAVGLKSSKAPRVSIRSLRVPKFVRPSCAALTAKFSVTRLLKSNFTSRQHRSATKTRSGRGAFVCNAYDEKERRRAEQAKKDPIAIALAVDGEANPYLVTLVRTFTYGVAAGLLFESGRSFLELSYQLTSLGWNTLIATLPALRDDFRPAVFLDHLVGIVFWAGLYSSQAYIVMKSMETSKREQLRATTTTELSRAEVADEIASTSATPLAFRDEWPDGALPPPPVFPSPPTTSTLPPVAAPAPSPRAKPETEKKKKRPKLKPGEWDPNNFLAGHNKRVQDRKKYLKNFWYAAALSENVGSKPVGVQMLDMDLVLFRSEEDGQVRCLSDICPHRGAPLSDGWTATHEGKSCVVCPYHGWVFDDEGRLRDVPANSKKATLPRSPIVDVFSVTERAGFVWLFYGDPKLPHDERPPIPVAPELEDPAWTVVYGEYTFEAPYMSVFENALDMAHIHFLHDDSFGNEDTPEVCDIVTERADFGCTSTFTMKNKPPSGLWEFSRTPDVDITMNAMLPCSSDISFELGGGIKMVTYVSAVPITGGRTVNRYALARNFLPGQWPGAQEYVRMSMSKIFSEDEEIVVKLKPEKIRREMNVRADLPQLTYRKLRQEYIDLGFGVMPAEDQGREDASGSLGDM